MSRWHLAFAAGFFAFCQVASAKPTRTLVMNESQVEEIRTALGFSTILDFGGRPGGVILGDQDAFKVEQMSGGLAIKPLFPGSKSNLFVFTDYDRFSFRLVTAPQAQADYRVVVKKKRDQGFAVESGKALRIKTLGTKKRCSGFTLILKRTAIPISEKVAIVDFSLKGPASSIQPGDFEILSGSQMVPVSDLLLSALKLDPTSGISGSAIIPKESANPGQELTLGFAPDGMGPKTRACLRIAFSPWGKQ